MEWVCEQHQKGKYLYTNACCSQVIGLQRASSSSSSSSVEQESSPTVLSSAGLGMSGTHNGPTGWRGQPVVGG
jgi:hypothetical protein